MCDTKMGKSLQLMCLTCWAVHPVIGSSSNFSDLPWLFNSSVPSAWNVYLQWQVGMWIHLAANLDDLHYAKLKHVHGWECSIALPKPFHTCNGNGKNSLYKFLVGCGECWYLVCIKRHTVYLTHPAREVPLLTAAAFLRRLKHVGVFVGKWVCLHL